MRTLCCSVCALLIAAALGGPGCSSHRPSDSAGAPPAALDLRRPMELACQAVVNRLDPAQDYRPFFLLRGRGGIPAAPEHASWDLGDMTGRYLEGLILARRMGVADARFAQGEERLQAYLLKLQGSDGLIHDPASGAIDHSFSHGSALYGLVQWFEDAHDRRAREAIEELITGQLRRLQQRGDQLVDPSVKLEQSSGSHLAGYQIYPAVRYYEMTGYVDALTFAEGLSNWALADPMLGADGSITKPLSWEGHIHSWLDTLAGCARTARHSKKMDRPAVIARCRAVYGWVRRTNMTDFGWIATFPTHGSSETCAISSAIRLALELADGGSPAYLDDVERFVRNQVVEAQFRDLSAYAGGPGPPTPLLLGCFDSQSMPNGHLGTRGGEDVGNVEGCCLNGGMRAIALAWFAAQRLDDTGVTVRFSFSHDGPGARVIGYQPVDGRLDVLLKRPGELRVRIPPWVRPADVSTFVDGENCPCRIEAGYAIIPGMKAGQRISIRYPLRDLREKPIVAGQEYQVHWRGDVVVGMDPPGLREPTYRGRLPQ